MAATAAQAETSADALTDSPADVVETMRLDALRGYGLLDTPSDANFDDFTRLASHICDAPIALITLLDADWQWHKSRIGIDSVGIARSAAFCHHAIKAAKTSSTSASTDAPFVVPDAWDDVRFANNPLVTSDPHVRFYAGAPLVTPNGYALGTLCVLDRVPRRLRPAEADALSALSRQLMQMIELRRVARDQKRLLSERRLTQAALLHARGILEQQITNGAHDLAELQSLYQAALDTLANVVW